MSADGETLHKALRHAHELLQYEPGMTVLRAAEEAAKQLDLGPLDEEWLLQHLKQENQQKNSGFSLIELLVSLVLIIILSLVMFGYWSKSYQESKMLLCQKNLQTIYMALRIYASENRQSYPFIANAATAEAPLSLLVPKDTAATEIFICPGSRDSELPEAQSFAQRRISYAYCMGLAASAGADQLFMSDRQVDATPKIKDQLVFSPDGKQPGNNHHRYGGCLLFGDGHAETTPAHASRDLSWPANAEFLNPQP